MSSQNITITVPGGTAYYQNPNQLCLPSSATNIILFFVGNYLAHIATVRSRPRDSFVENLITSAFCLFFPAYGLSIAVPMIVSCANFAKTAVQKATRAGALVMVVRNDKWTPKSGNKFSCAILHSNSRQSSTAELSNVVVSESVKTWEAWTAFVWGSPAEIDNEQLNISMKLPKGYSFRIVPRDAVVEEPNEDHPHVRIQYSFNLPKVVIAVVQLVYALISLYRARNHQITRYGYAAFAITIVPYAVMSFVNLISIAFCPDFSDFYLVDSSVLREARDRLQTRAEQDKEIPVVGTLAEEERSPNTSQIDVKRSTVGSITVGASEVRFTSNEHEIPPSPDHEAEEGRVRTSEQPKVGYTVYIPCSEPLKRYRHPVRQILCSSNKREDALPILREPWHRFFWGVQDTINVLFLLLFYGVTLAIVSIISGFKPGQGTLAQRVWIMMWLVTGFAWVLIDLAGDYAKTRVEESTRKTLESLLIIVAVLFAAPAMGGFVVVGKMLNEYGTCILL